MRSRPLKNSWLNAEKASTTSPYRWTISKKRWRVSRPPAPVSLTRYRDAELITQKLHSFTPQAQMGSYWSWLNMRSDVRIGIVGGSGLYQMAGLTEIEEAAIDTPFGKPSDSYRIGTLEGRKVAFLARHHRNHTILPSELNFRANIHGFKQLGVEWILSASAVGSLKEELRPLDVVLPDQFYDRTKARISTFFGEGVVVHVSFADPICQQLSGI